MVKKLSRDATRLLREPFALYIVALATTVDAQALEWLWKWQMAFDSMSGPSVAFLFFYNEARLEATPGIVSWAYDRSPSREHVRALATLKGLGLLDAYDSYCSEREAARPFRVFGPDVPAAYGGSVLALHVDEETLRSGSAKVDAVLSARVLNEIRRREHRGLSDWERYDPSREASLSERVFVQSMTYESDAVARSLGIHDLPCLLFIDDPESDTPCVLPLGEPGQETLTDIRNILQDFQSARANAQYLHVLSEWKRLDVQRKEIAATVYEMSCENSSEFARVARLLRSARSYLGRGDTTAFRTEIETAVLAHGQLTQALGDPAPAEIDWSSLDSALQEVAILAHHHKTIYSAAYRWKKVHPRHLPALHEALAYVTSVLPECHGTVDASQLRAVEPRLADSLAAKVDAAMQSVIAAFGASWQHADTTDQVSFFSAFGERAAEAAARMEACLGELNGMSRPSVRKHVESVLRRRGLKTAAHRIVITATNAGRTAPVLMDVLTRASKLHGP
ncbi:hypothetical protein FDZ71_00175 [bacterium]|nr:MAG: hypothetical protein FDZ71_00175 [bacterium]